MTSTHLVKNSRARRVRRSVYDSFIPPSRPSATAGQPTTGRRPPAPSSIPVLGPLTITTSADGDWTDLATYEVDQDRTPSASEATSPRDSTADVERPGTSAPAPTEAATTSVPARPSPDEQPEATSPSAALLALAQRVASGTTRPEIRAEALEWLRDLGRTTHQA